MNSKLKTQNHKSSIDNRQLGISIAELAIEYADQRVPYQHRGTSRNGCDCTGLIVAICRELGYLKKFVLRQYREDWNLHAGAGNQVIEELRKFGVEIPKREAGIGDIPVMLFGKCPAHCGIIVARGPVIVHSLKSEHYCNKSVLKKSMWSARWVTTFRLIEEKLN